MPKTYTTILGDMWDVIAFKTLGNANYKDVLIKSNLRHKYIFLFPAGVVLTIPDIEVKPPPTLPPWKRQ